MENRKVSITRKLTNLIIVSLALSVIFFALIHSLGDQLMNHYFCSDQYYTTKNARMINKFSAYVKDKKLSTKDRKAFKKWIKREKYTMLKIYRDNQLVYDSTYNRGDETGYLDETESQYEQHKSHIVLFSDGKADVIVNGDYSFKYYDMAFVAEFMMSCIIFIVIVLLGVQKTILYIKKINEEIHILEGGDLDYVITVHGNDELSMLAQSIDELRNAFVGKLRLIAKLQRESREMVTEMSHDMRTPLTVILMYLGFARDMKNESFSEMMEYINKIYDKAIYIKNLSDKMFAYFLLDKEEALKLEVVFLKEVFYDSISDMVAFLQSMNYKTSDKMVFPDIRIMINREYIGRIFNNLISNILKYADIENEIEMFCSCENDTVEIHFRNVVKPLEEGDIESTGLGLRIVAKMMEQMHGEYSHLQEGIYYESVLKFEVVEK